MKPEVASRRIESFRQRFGEAHLYFAYHAAFPLALNPDLLYRLWANFQRDIHGELLNIPWLAVADLLLSSLCDEVGYELYEMDKAVRNLLLRELQDNSRFGKQRIDELSDFLLTYVREQLESHDPYIRDFAQAQKWTALAYTKPSEAARELALTLSKLKLEEKAEWVRMASMIETFAEPLAEFKPLLIYAYGMSNFVRGNQESATAEIISLIVDQEKQLNIAGFDMFVPKSILSKLPKYQLTNHELFTSQGVESHIQESETEQQINTQYDELKNLLNLKDQQINRLLEILQDQEKLLKVSLLNSSIPRIENLKVSELGLKAVDNARQKKGWEQLDLAWLYAADISPTILMRFWQKLDIPKDSFIAICQAVGLEKDWQALTEPRQSAHFSTLRTKITDSEILKQSLHELGIQVQTDAYVRGGNGLRVSADIVAVLEGQYDIGWSQNSDGSLDLIADIFSISQEQNIRELINKINQKYAANIKSEI